MKTLLRLATVLLLGASTAFAADQTWSGKISDSKCGASHKSAIEHAGKNLSDADCTAACVKGGATYVFVNDGKVYNIENQDAAGLAENAGKMVTLTGTMTGDTVKVTKVAAGGKKASS